MTRRSACFAPWAVATLCTLAAICSAASLSSCSQSPAPSSWAQAKQQDLILTVPVIGELAAKHSDSIGPPQIAEGGQYKISRMVAEGTEVHQGDEVVAFDTSELEQKLRDRQNEYDQVLATIERHRSDTAVKRRDERLTLSEAEGQLRRAALKAQGDSELYSSIEIQTATLEHKLANRQLRYVQERNAASQRNDAQELSALQAKARRAQDRVAQINRYLQSMSVRSPRDATVIYLPNWQGQKKKVGDGVWRGEVFLQTASIDEMIAEGQVAEAQMSELAVGQAVTLRLEAHPDDEYVGTIRHIGKLIDSPSVQSPLRIAKVEVALERASAMTLRPGMRFSGSIEVGRRGGATVIPVPCVFTRDQGPVVYRQAISGFEEVGVRLGQTAQGLVEVLEGVAPGQALSTIDLSSEASR